MLDTISGPAHHLSEIYMLWQGKQYERYIHRIKLSHDDGAVVVDCAAFWTFLYIDLIFTFALD